MSGPTFPIVLLDIETTGLCWDEDSIVLEIGMSRVSTGFELLNPETWVVYQKYDVLFGSNPWIIKTHSNNGLFNACRDGLRSSFVEEKCMQYLFKWGFEPGKVLVAGNSVWTDRVHLRRHMPALETWFFHRNMDFSVFKETAKIFGIPEDKSDIGDDHRARPGLDAALDRFKFYYDKFISPALVYHLDQIEIAKVAREPNDHLEDPV